MGDPGQQIVEALCLRAVEHLCPAADDRTNSGLCQYRTHFLTLVVIAYQDRDVATGERPAFEFDGARRIEQRLDLGRYRTADAGAHVTDTPGFAVVTQRNLPQGQGRRRFTAPGQNLGFVCGRRLDRLEGYRCRQQERVFAAGKQVVNRVDQRGCRAPVGAQ